ncbi:hypothetical protein HFP15_02225 [Amycolatopsis sp. K13G38]|uniref:DUF2530 domain-containing protein n=1 Tax=Amycolatopsis acididurans TaxID=2724524 RepID=A0ABX1IW37_9PSEU|nr:hypothetical protein [Amycolatopsis acididurans]NKQ51694.1 hypothetical protein [Amycolatopsis acididurans]
MAELRAAVVLFVAWGLTIIAVVSVPLILEAGGTAYRWGVLGGSVVLAAVCWTAVARRPR